ncbi:MAG: GAF domain-containing sensor histidine kinase [Anaerolinea sp.]|nr:GAF domain-containing sensor histidine kinase [Anaerolinea sp.]
MTIDDKLLAASAKIYSTMLSVAAAESPEMVLQQAAAAAVALVDGARALVVAAAGTPVVVHPAMADVGSLQPVATWLLASLLQQPDLPELEAASIPDALASPSFSDPGFSFVNLLAVPMRAEKELYGALAIFNREGGAAFTAVERDWLQVLAAYTAVSLRKAHLLQLRKTHSEQLEERNRQLASFSHAARNIAGELALDKVLQQIVDSARELVRAEYVAMGVPNNEGMLDMFIHSGMSAAQIAQIPHLPRGHGLLGAIIQEKRPIRIPSIRRDPRAVGFPEGHPTMESFLGVPVMAGGETLGNLYLTNKTGASEFSSDDQKVVELLAAHAAVAIQNARLYEQVGRLVIVEERTRIGMDLHDGIIQSIYAVGLTLESTRLSLNDGALEDADRLLEVAIKGLNETIRDIRNFILDLRPYRFKGNLYDGLSKLVREFQVNTMVEVNLITTTEMLADLRTPLARAIFLTTQEALANVARHARAKHVEISVIRTETMVQLTVSDNGRGFDTMEHLKATVGHGLSNMRARAEELKGTFHLHSVLGQGTRIVLMIPLVR